MADLEGTKAQVEAVEPDKVKQTQQKEESTVSNIENTPEFRQMVDKAVGKSTASLQSQVTISKQAVKAAQAESESLKAVIANLESAQADLATEVDRMATERFSDDPEALRGYKMTKTLELRERKLKAAEAALDLKKAELDGLSITIALNNVADSLLKEYKVPRKVLEACTSEQQMRDIAENFPKIDEDDIKSAAKKDPKFDSGISSGGLSIKDLTPEEKFKRGMASIKK